MIGVCRVCGCTDTSPCVESAAQINGSIITEPCWWVEPDLCSSCDRDRPLEVGDESAPPPLLYDAYGRPIYEGGVS